MQPSPKGEIWRETWLKAQRQLASWVPGRLTGKSHKPSIWFSMASLLFCADTQLVPPTVTHRSPERKHTEPGDMLENKKLPGVLFLKGGLRTAPTTEGWGWDWCVYALASEPTALQRGWHSPACGTCCTGVGWRDLSQKLVLNTLCKNYNTQYPLIESVFLFKCLFKAL